MCDRCATNLVDLHRACPGCGWDYCVPCCREMRAEAARAAGEAAAGEPGGGSVGGEAAAGEPAGPLTCANPRCTGLDHEQQQRHAEALLARRQSRAAAGLGEGGGGDAAAEAWLGSADGPTGGELRPLEGAPALELRRLRPLEELRAWREIAQVRAARPATASSPACSRMAWHAKRPLPFASRSDDPPGSLQPGLEAK
jgi:hypothetical protein